MPEGVKNPHVTQKPVTRLATLFGPYCAEQVTVLETLWVAFDRWRRSEGLTTVNYSRRVDCPRITTKA